MHREERAVARTREREWRGLYLQGVHGTGAGPLQIVGDRGDGFENAEESPVGGVGEKEGRSGEDHLQG